MNKAIQWMAHNHVAANLLMMVFVVGGVIMAMSIKQEVFPEVVLDRVRINVPYPGASPDEVEEGIILKIEENIHGIDGIKEIKSEAMEGFGLVTAEIISGEDVDLILQDIKSEVDRITTFPQDAEKPIISKVLNRRQVISVVVYGNVSERTLREQVEDIRDDLLAHSEITQVDLVGVRPYEISIEIPEENLRRYNLTLEQVAQRVRRASLDLPAGSIKEQGGEILIRTKEKRYHGAEYDDITVVVNPDGSEVMLRDLATVLDTFEEIDQFARFDGTPAAMVAISRVGDQKPTVISKVVNEYITKKQETLPESLHIAEWNDRSELLKSRMDLLIKNALLGLVLVFVILSLFLQIRLALWVMLGIPISFLGALFLMPAMDVSINMISLFAFIMALGIVVDDAIVIGENVFDHRNMGKSYLRAAVDGAREVAVPVTFSILTSVAAFLPLVYVTGGLGKFIKVIPMVAVTILLVSLVESLFVLPAHLSLGQNRPTPGRLAKRIDRPRLRVARGLEKFVAGPYRSFLSLCLENRYATVAASIAALLITIGLVVGGTVKFRFMPEVDGDIINVKLELPRGTPVKETAAVQKYIIQKGRELVAEYDHGREKSVLRNIYSMVGSTIAGGGPTGGGGTASAAYLSDMQMRLLPSEQRGIPAEQIANKWREKVGELPGIESLTFESNVIRLGANIDIRLAHNDFEVLNQAATRVKKALATYTGVGDIADNFAQGKKEIKIRLKPEARTLGITEEDLGRQIRGAFYGAEALRLQRGRNEVKVMVRYPEKQRKSLWNLESMRIRTPDGGEVPLDKAAHLEEGRGYSEINRTDQKRVINVTASVDGKVANAEEVLDTLKKTILKEVVTDYQGLTYNLEGEQKERRESMASMGKGFRLALFAIFVLLAIPFRSYTQPLLIMTAIPFGIVGAIVGHLLMGFDISMLSIFGVVALSGVVVNDSLLLIDKINRNRHKQDDVHEALLNAGQRRFRPILLTSLTTFFGLAPMISETSVQAQFLIPMAISLGFGILFATGITLLLIPCLYLVLEDVRGLFKLQPLHHNNHEQ